MGVKLVASSGGSVELVPTNTASNFTVTVPAKTGTMAMDGPAFSAYLGASQTISNSTWTKVQLSAEQFDTNNNFDSTTNYRFTPTVAGYYQFNATWGVNATATAIQIAIYKNGSSFAVLSQTAASTSTTSGSYLAYANGSTDYFEFYVWLATGETHPSTTGCFFQASMVRAA
jgi:hypothetical protein